MISDTDVILSLLADAGRRTRRNRLLKDLGFKLIAIASIPVVFKLVDFYYPFQAWTVIFVLLAWTGAAAISVAWSFRRTGSAPGTVASSIDRAANLHDLLKTADWFIRHPRDSAWVSAQLARAASEAKRLDVKTLYPRPSTRPLYTAGALLILAGILNFVPLSQDHNWFYLQAAPAFPLTADEQRLLARAKELLEQSGRTDDAAMAQRIESTMKDLQARRISMDDAVRRLGEIRGALEQGSAGRAKLERALEAMAHDLAQDDGLRPIAEALAARDLAAASQRVRELAQGLSAQAMTPEMREQLGEAAENTVPGLEAVAEELRQAASAGDTPTIQAALDRAAEALQGLSENLAAQDRQAEAGQEIASLSQSLEARQPANTGAESGGPLNLGNNPIPTGGLDNSGDGSQPVAGSDAAAAADIDISQIAVGGSQPDVPLYAEPTRLDVELVKSGLTGQASPDIEAEEIEQATRQERSELKYQRVESAQVPIRKDLPKRDRLPAKYRSLVRQYFETLPGSSSK